LQTWKLSVSRKPLLLRGARQVGKSSSVREFGKQFEYFLEVNFEKKENQDAKIIFERSSSPKRITEELFAMFGIPVVPGKTLLFLDEIQTCIPAISSLRFFYEEMPELHVIAAGSLLEFALDELPSFGVGRIRSLFMYPLSFDEYLRAMGFEHEQIKEAVELLTMAGLVYPVTHTSANGVPLAAELNPKTRKYIVFDTGIMQRFLGLDIAKILLGDTLTQINKGSVAELFVGLEIVKSMLCYQPAQLYYWQREQRGSQAEIDYIVQRGSEIIPIEVKSGTRGAMQSLYLFMKEKNSARGIRTSLENFGKIGNIDVYPMYGISELF
jgi:predicted AAA+ superfamily ATPase